MAVELVDLVEALPSGGHVIGNPRVRVVTLSHDSRSVGPGSLFCCVSGERRDGHEFAADAVEAGASALLTERPLRLGVPELVVPSVRWAMGPVSSAVYGHPSSQLKVVGITGTNGKTTTSWLLQAVLQAAGMKCGLLGTLSGAFTTPEAPQFQQALAGFAAEGCQAVSLEVSSHGLALGRVDGTRFAVGVFTNLSRDHLDLHGDEESYFAAKARLFEPERCAHAVLNADDVRGRWLAEHLSIPVTTFSLLDASDISLTASSATYRWRGQTVRLGIGGEFSVANALAASQAASALGIDDATVARGLSDAPAVPGRFEPVVAGQPYSVIVDFAHTPDGLANALRAARAVTTGRVYVVFGCGGDRDRTKRPLMGRVAIDLADSVVVTSDNPRTEDAEEIIADIIDGIPLAERHRVTVYPQRREAMATTFGRAFPGDCVLIAGKGHETTQTIGATQFPFDDRAVARELLAEVLP